MYINVTVNTPYKNHTPGDLFSIGAAQLPESPYCRKVLSVHLLQRHQRHESDRRISAPCIVDLKQEITRGYTCHRGVDIVNLGIVVDAGRCSL